MAWEQIIQKLTKNSVIIHSFITWSYRPNYDSRHEQIFLQKVNILEFSYNILFALLGVF